MTKTTGAPRYTYSPEEVVEFRDDDHTPYNKTCGQVDSILVMQVRSPDNADWVGFNVQETTTTKNHGAKSDVTYSRTTSFSMPREQFDAIVAHVKREAK